MRTIFTTFLVVAFFFSKAQTTAAVFGIDSATNNIKYQVIKDQPDSKDALFTKAQTWIASVFKNTKAVIDVTDRPGGLLLFSGNTYTSYPDTLFTKKGAIKSTSQMPCIITFKGKFYLKDNKYKFVVTDITMRLIFMTNSEPDLLSKTYYDQWVTDSFNGPFKKIFTATDKSMRNLLISATTYMAQKDESDF